MNKRIITLALISLMTISVNVFASNEFQQLKNALVHEVSEDINKLSMMIKHDTYFRTTQPFSKDFKLVLLKHTISCDQRRRYLEELLPRFNAVTVKSGLIEIQNELLSRDSEKEAIQSQAHNIGCEYLKFSKK